MLLTEARGFRRAARRAARTTPPKPRPALNRADTPDPPSRTSRVLSHAGRNVKRYSIGAAAAAAGGSAATKGGQQAGKKSVGQSDPHYNTNFRAGQATFSDRNRKIKKSLGESLREAIGKAARWRAAQKVKGAVTPERVAAGTAAGVGLTYVGSRAAGGVKQGRQDKRKQGMTHGYEDAFRNRREALDASDFGYVNKDTPARRRKEDADPFAEDAAAGIKNKVSQAVEFRRQHKVKGVGGDAVVDAIGKVKESELEEVRGFIKAGKGAVGAAKATRAGRVAGKAVPWTSRGLIATDIAVLGGGAAKAGASAAQKKPSEQKEGARLSRAGALAGQSVKRGDPLIFGTGTALGVRAKSRDLGDDQKLNQSHIRNRKD